MLLELLVILTSGIEPLFDIDNYVPLPYSKDCDLLFVLSSRMNHY